jgi:indole-3-glycerol phosphate synthase
MNILEKIIAQKKIEISEEKKKLPLHELEKKIIKNKPGRFINAFSKDKMTFICEVKKASPSKGIIRENFNHLEIGNIYAENGAGAISVLTDEKFFMGSLDYLDDISKAVKIPLIRKDFIIDEYQIAEANIHGASAILLIAAVLNEGELTRLYNFAKTLGLDVLLEVHNQNELKKALNTDARIIGINNRDLKTFKTNLETTGELISQIPRNRITVSESGINTPSDVKKVFDYGARGVLIGEALCREDDIAVKLKTLISFM